ncbi:MAG: manganese efflux pump MntP family protein [Pseudoflavonifractor sp.]|nr:manganese efflux pump MntP family protein [Pseudoflavonifractor sp.]
MVEIFLIAVSLAMDAFAVSISTGIAVPGFGPRQAARIGAWCGFFQFAMPLIGWFLGSSVRSYIEAVDHWIAFALLALIGGHMIRDALSGGGEEAVTDLSTRRLFFLALATSIDALAVGVSMAFMEVNILLASVVIGAVAFLLAMLGGLLGRRLGDLFQRRATLLGGAVLVCIGAKILVQHLSGAA